MQNRDAYETVGVNVGVEDGWLEAHRRWLKRVRGRKAESSREYATFKRGAVGPWHERLPFQVVVLRDGAYGGKESVGIGGKLFVFYGETLDCCARRSSAVEHDVRGDGALVYWCSFRMGCRRKGGGGGGSEGDAAARASRLQVPMSARR